MAALSDEYSTEWVLKHPEVVHFRVCTSFGKRHLTYQNATVVRK